MAYSKIEFQNGQAPGISAERLNHIQTQYDHAKNEIDVTKTEFDTHTDLAFNEGAHGYIYEEGEWNPVIRAGANQVQSYTYRHGYYERHGNMVVVNYHAQINVSGIQSGSTPVVDGLPFVTPSNFGKSDMSVEGSASQFIYEGRLQGTQVRIWRMNISTSPTSWESMSPTAIVDGMYFRGFAIYSI